MRARGYVYGKLCESFLFAIFDVVTHLATHGKNRVCDIITFCDLMEDYLVVIWTCRCNCWDDTVRCSVPRWVSYTSSEIVSRLYLCISRSTLTWAIVYSGEDHTSSAQNLDKAILIRVGRDGGNWDFSWFEMLVISGGYCGVVFWKITFGDQGISNTQLHTFDAFGQSHAV